MKLFYLLIFGLIGLLQISNAQNLILNPSCDDALVNGNIPFWQEINGMNWSQRCGSPNPLPNNGTCYFFAGADALDILTQTIDVTSFASSIDNGSQIFYFHGYETSYAQSPPDEANIFIEFNDSTNTQIGSIHFGPYSQTAIWQELDSALQVPPLTRSVIIKLRSERRNGSNNDGYYDQLYLGGTPFSGIAPHVAFQSSDTSFCKKQCIDFTDLSTNNPTSWYWYFPGADSATSTMQNPAHICYDNYGVFDVTLIACNNAGCDTLFMPGFITEYPAPLPTITKSNDTLYSSPALSYQWWNVDSGEIAGATQNYFIPSYPGGYFVVVTDGYGCEGASNVSSVISVNENYLSSSLKVYPNPFNGKFNIEKTHNLKQNITLVVSNNIGQKIKEVALKERTTEVDLGTIEGVYYLTFSDKNYHMTRKIILQHLD